jgi:transcription elongation factor Elf1
MTEETEIRIPFGDLTRVSFDCKQCGAEITVDISKEEHFSVANHEQPMKCPICGGRFDSQLKQSFSTLSDWLDRVRQSGHHVYFRIRRD